MAKICKHTGMLKECQKLSCNGQAFEHNLQLRNYGVSDGCMISLGFGRLQRGRASIGSSRVAMPMRRPP